MNQDANTKPRLKTPNKLKQILFHNSLFRNGVFRRVDNCYTYIKRKNAVFNFVLKQIAFMIRIILVVLSPITNLVKKPIYSVDSYLNDKINDWTESCLKISKPTEQVN
jgi:hypothetical protein